MLSTIIQLPPWQNTALINPWTFAHRAHHTLITNALNSVAPAFETLPDYIMDPIDFNDIDDWLQQHQMLHNYFNAYLKYPGNDLQDVDLNDPVQRDIWSYYHFLEHQNAEVGLKIFNN